MDNAEHVLETLTNAEHHLTILSAATRIDDVIGATNSYLSSWSNDRIEELRRIDGGWGPFEYQGRPEQISAVADITRISFNLSRQCAALKEAGINPTAEILELDLFFALARNAAAAYRIVGLHPYPEKSRKPDYRHWSDQIAAAA